MMAEMMHEDEQETEPKNRHASHARTGTMSLTNRRPSRKAIATEKAPGAGIGESWGGSKDGSITFVKNDGEGGGAWCEVAASVCCRTQQPKLRKERGAWINTRFTPGAGFNGKGGLGPLFG
jgi:hypothetical protein